MKRRGFFSAGCEIACGFLIERRLRAAVKRMRRKPDLGEPGLDRVHVAGLAAMRGTGERDMRIAQAKAVSSARFDQRQRLNHFRC